MDRSGYRHRQSKRDMKVQTTLWIQNVQQKLVQSVRMDLQTGFFLRVHAPTISVP